jgi:tetratricopeptide (TPR) repeat protein
VRVVPSAVENAASTAWEAYQRGDVAAARAALVALEPGDVPAWAAYVLGLSELALGNVPAAVAAWGRVRREAPDFEPVYFDLADAHISRGDLGEALNVLRDAAARWPQDAEVWNATGVVLLRRSALDEAIGAFEKATTVAPDEGLGFYNLGRALEMRFERSRRWSRLDRSWASRPSDIANALLAYQRAAALGGATADSAKTALARIAR